MPRIKAMTCPLAMLVLLTASLLLAQTRTSPPTSAPPATTGQTPTQGRGRRQPCWQQAGVSQSAAQQHRQIEENSRAQIETVCSDSSLSPQQKEQKIHQLREESRKQLAGLLNPQQEQALKSCRQQRGGGEGRGGHGGGGGAHAGGGPCGEMPAASHGAKPFQQSESESKSDEQ